MECPKCRKQFNGEQAVCPYCGTRVKSESGKIKRVKKRRKNKLSVSATDGERLVGVSEKHGKKPAKALILTAVIACILIVIILIAVIASSLFSSKGIKYAESSSKYIGYSLSALESGEDMHYKDESDCFGVNSAVSFDYVLESDSRIKADGISYPSWAVFLKISDAKFISEVTYTDFTQVKKDMRGEKHGSLVNLDSFSEGAKQSAVLKKIDMNPYSITYSQKGLVIYTYKYYYTRDNGDEQQVILRVAFSEKGKYKYSSTELIYPSNM